MVAPSSQPTLDLKVQGMSLEIEISNDSSDLIRIWDRNNSWGYATLSLDLARASQQNEVYTLTPPPRIWTKNGPVFIEIAAGGCHVMLVTAQQPKWNGLERLNNFRDETLNMRANLRVPPTPEAEELEVFVGEVSSPWRESQPPHRWLFSDT